MAENLTSLNFGRTFRCIWCFDCQIRQRLEVQKKTLEELEAQHLETGRSMKDFSLDADEQTAIMLKYRSEQNELEHQRHVLEDLEFQMFEATDTVIHLFLFSVIG